MTTTKKALITGITGQDGSYLAELLLEKGYEVHGLIRRSSTFNTERIGHLYKDIHTEDTKLYLHYGDLSVSSCLTDLLTFVKPDEIYNLGAQSHVRVSFDMPEYTSDIVGIGTLRLLEAIRRTGIKTKFYQASSSEMFGSVPPLQSEITSFQPQSPYAAAKVYAYYMTRNYREAYNIFACNGILFNHECVSENSPVIVRSAAGMVSIKRIKDIRKAKEKGSNVQQWAIKDDLEVWDGESFSKLKLITATRRSDKNDDYICKIINTRNGCIEVTNHHNMLDHKSTKLKAVDVQLKDSLLHGKMPLGVEALSSITEEEAELIGMLVADGWINENGAGSYSKKDPVLITRIKELWKNAALGTIYTGKERKSGFGTSVQTRLNGNSSYLKFLYTEIYTQDGYKKIPDRVLNSTKDVKLSFLKGYNNCDGLKKNPCIYEFKNFKTNSSLLAQGLLFLISTVTNQCFNLTFEKNDKHFGYYSINLLSNLKKGKSGQHLVKPKNEVKKIICHNKQPVWVYDLEVESGKFMCGVGNIIVSNSPRRGETFVTRKITRAATRIKMGLQDKLYLGNLEAKRDWGYAGDYVKAMWLMLQHQLKADDYVIATGETHSVKEFVIKVFELLNLNWEEHVIIDPKYYRPTEVNILQGDASKAKRILGWEPTVNFEQLIERMLINDLKLAKQEKLIKGC